MNGDAYGGHSSAGSPSQGSKRKAEDGSGGHTRSKRNRYIAIACNECKRRKIKCNGNQPCQRCGNLSLECIYAPNCCSNSLKDSEEFQQMRSHIASLQQQLDTLVANLTALRQQLHVASPGQEPAYCTRDAPSLSGVGEPPSPRSQRKSYPRFHGPTSSRYGFEVANSTLKTMGITEDSIVDEPGVPSDRTATASPLGVVPTHPSKDPLWSISRDEAIRLCRVYEEEIGIMYPLFDTAEIVKHVNMLWTFLEAAIRSGIGNMPGADCIDDDDTNLTKVVLAAALILEGSGQSDLGQRLFHSLKPAVTAKIWGPTNIKGLSLLCVAAMYYFNRGDEGQAWRLIGISARACIEMGLHRQESLLRSFTNEAEYLAATNLFWVVYALDRRWSFGTGMPFALQDADVDPNMPEPDDSSPYLQQITKYNRLASKVWYYNASHDVGTESRHDDIGFLDYQLLQWYEQIPESLQFNRRDIASEHHVRDRGQRRLRLILYLRANQARISIYRPILNSTTSILGNLQHARTVVDAAKDTISVLATISHTTDIYRTQQVCYNYFLVQSLAVIFLAVAHAPAEFARNTRDEFYAALDIVRGFSTTSYISKQLWQTIRGLRDVGEKIGLQAHNGGSAPDHSGDVGDPHSNAAVAMAGLAGHPIENLALHSGGMGGQSSDLASNPQDGQQLSTELTHLFELAGGYRHTMSSPAGGELLNGFMSGDNEGQAEGEGMSNAFGDEQEFSRIVGALF